MALKIITVIFAYFGFWLGTFLLLTKTARGEDETPQFRAFLSALWPLTLPILITGEVLNLVGRFFETVDKSIQGSEDKK